MLRTCALIVSFVILTFAPRAFAEPYQLTAHYVARAKGGQPIDLTISDNDVLLRQSTDYELQSVSADLKTDDISLASLANFRDLSFGIKCNGAPCATPPAGGPVVLEMSSAQKGQSVQLLDPARIPAASATFSVAIDVESHFQRQYLCTQESAMRAKNGKPVKNTPEVFMAIAFGADKDGKPFDGVDRSATQTEAALRLQLVKKDGQKAYDRWAASWKTTPPSADGVAIATAMSTFSSQALTDQAGAQIFYSFCDSLASRVDWTVLAALGNASTPLSDAIAQLEAKQKAALSSELNAFLSSQTSFAGMRIVLQSDRPGLPTNEMVTNTHAFSLLPDLGQALTFREVNPSAERDLKGSVDEAASVRLEVDPSGGGVCQSGVSCERLVASFITASLTSTDNQGNPIQKDIALTSVGGDRWLMAAALSDYLDKDVTFTVSYKSGASTFVLRKETVHVDNLGLVTTVPLATEIASLVADAKTNSVNPKDAEWQSSIPISWAFDASSSDTASGAQHVAVTLPWMIGVNTREVPHLSDIVKVFPHVSAVLPTSSSASQSQTQVVFGAGVAFENTFTLAWGLSASQAHNYVFVGVSLPDLVKAFKAP